MRFLLLLLAILISGAAQAALPYIDMRPIHLVATKEDSNRWRSPWDNGLLASYTTVFFSLDANGEPLYPNSTDESKNTLNADGSLDVEYNQYDRYVVSGFATHIYYRFNPDKLYAQAGLSANDWDIAAVLCPVEESPEQCSARIYNTSFGGTWCYPLTGVTYESEGQTALPVASRAGMGVIAVDPVPSDCSMSPSLHTALFSGLKQYYFLYTALLKSAINTPWARNINRRDIAVGEPITLRYVPAVATQRADTKRGGQYWGTIQTYTEAQRQMVMATTLSSNPARRLRVADDRNVNATLNHEREWTVQQDGRGVPYLAEKGTSAGSYPFRIEASSRGLLTNRSMNVAINPATADLGKTGNIWIAACIPNMPGCFFYSNGGWVADTTGLTNPPPVYGQSVTLNKMNVSFIQNMDITVAAYGRIYVGYGTSFADLAGRGTFAQVAYLYGDMQARPVSTTAPNIGYLMGTYPPTF